MTKKTEINLNRRWDAPKGAVAYPMEGEGPPHPAYMGTAIDALVWLGRWERLADRRCLDADLYAAYDPYAYANTYPDRYTDAERARMAGYPQQRQRRMPL